MIVGQKVICSIPEDKRRVKGVISGVSPDVQVETIKKNLTGATVYDGKRLKCNRNNKKKLTFSQS